MREELANLVYPVFTHALRVKRQLEEGAAPNLAAEQAALKGLLQTELEARRTADFGGEGVPAGQSGLGLSPAGGPPRRSADAFLGIRYALACWLDEVFILDSPWGPQWNERKIEEALYGTNDRAWKFWEQAQRAEARPGPDAFEVFYLCVMLGFRGELRGKPDKLRAWTLAAQARIGQSQAQEWPAPPELPAPTDVPPRRGRERLQRMLRVGGALLLVLVPVVAFFVVKQLAGDGCRS